MSYLSGHAPDLIFGVGENGQADSLQVTWSDGWVSELSGVSAGKIAVDWPRSADGIGSPVARGSSPVANPGADRPSPTSKPTSHPGRRYTARGCGWHNPSRSRIRQNSGMLGDSPNSGEFSYEPIPTACGAACDCPLASHSPLHFGCSRTLQLLQRATQAFSLASAAD